MKGDLDEPKSLDTGGLQNRKYYAVRVPKYIFGLGSKSTNGAGAKHKYSKFA